MEALMLAAVIGIPLALALYVIDTIARQVPTWRTQEQLQAATGAFWDRPVGRRVPRHAGAADAEVRPAAERVPAGGARGSRPAPAGTIEPASRPMG